MSQALVVSQTTHYENMEMDRITTTWSNGNVNSRYVYRDPGQCFSKHPGGALNDDAVIGTHIALAILVLPIVALCYIGDGFDHVRKMFKKV